MMKERGACKGYTGYVKMQEITGIPCGVRDFTVQGMNTMNGEI